MISYSDVIFNTLKEIGEPAKMTDIRDRTNIDGDQIYECLRKLVKNGDITREYRYDGTYRGSTIGLIRKRVLYWSVS